MMTFMAAYVLTASGTERIPKQSSYALKRSEVQMRALAKVLVLLAWVVLIPTAALAQAVIAGTVRDTSGAVLPGVTVVAKSPSLQLSGVTAVTDAQGEYRLTPLPIGIYTVEYTLSVAPTSGELFSGGSTRIECGLLASNAR